MPYKRHIMKPAQTNSVWFLTCRCFSYNLVSLLEILTMLIHFLMVLQFWVVFWMWFCVAVLRIKQVSWQIWRALWQGWSRMNVLRECPIRLSRHIWGCFFRHVRRYFFKRKIPRTLNHPKAYHTLISVAFQPFAGDMLHPYAQGEMGKVALGKVIYGRFWDCDVRSNGLHTAHLWCEIQLPGPVERYGQTGSAGAFNEGMNEPSLFWRRFDKARSLQYSWSMAILRKFFFSSSLSDYARSTGWLRQELDTKRSEFSAGSRGCIGWLDQKFEAPELICNEGDGLHRITQYACQLTNGKKLASPSNQTKPHYVPGRSDRVLKRPSRRFVHCSSINHITYFYIHYGFAQVPCLCTMQ